MWRTLAGGRRIDPLAHRHHPVGLAAVPAAAASLDAAAINNAEYPAKRAADDRIDAAVVKIQVWLDRARFSPGEIDGKLGENAQKALKAFAEAKSLPSDKLPNPEIWKALAGSGEDAAIVEYKISDKDVKGPFLEKLPAKMDDMKELKALGYTSPREALAEKFHMSEDLLAALNPGKKFDKAGEAIFVANVLNKPAKLTVGRIEVDKAAQTVKAFDAVGCPCGVLSGNGRQRREADADGQPQGPLQQCQSELPLQSRLQIQGREIDQALHHQARPEQPGGFVLDRARS